MRFFAFVIKLSSRGGGINENISKFREETRPVNSREKQDGNFYHPYASHFAPDSLPPPHSSTDRCSTEYGIRLSKISSSFSPPLFHPRRIEQRGEKNDEESRNQRSKSALLLLSQIGGEKWYYISSIITISIGRHLKKRPRKRCPLFDDKSETLSAKGEWRGMKESGGRVGRWATARGFPTVDLFKWIDKSRCHLFLPPFLSVLSIRSNRPREQLGERFRKTLMSILLLAITFTRSYEK